jgi:hypothetical protein
MKTYTTKDFYCAAYLIAAKIEPQNYKIQGTQLAFLFEDSDKLQDHVTSYYGLTATINPVAYGNALRNLKSVVHAYKDKESESKHVQQSRKAN